MIILNLGCGTKVSASPDILNIDWSMYLRMKRNRFLQSLAPFLLDGERLNRFYDLPDNVMLHNLSKGIPFASNSVDVVYHSHLFEHLDRSVAHDFLSEIRRVLKTGGILRIVVPDLENLCRSYLSHIVIAEANPKEADLHDEYVARMIEQSVRREAYGTSRQPLLRRWIENKILGDARQRGETHQWMYDKINLGNLLSKFGYRNIEQRTYDTSLIPKWQDYGLDLDEDGNEYKPGSLYLEAIK
jgi:predicted SAM-dependent methyltransferase